MRCLEQTPIHCTGENHETAIRILLRERTVVTEACATQIGMMCFRSEAALACRTKRQYCLKFGHMGCSPAAHHDERELPAYTHSRADFHIRRLDLLEPLALELRFSEASALDESLCDLSPRVFCRRVDLPRTLYGSDCHDGTAWTPVGGDAAVANVLQPDAGAGRATIAALAIDRRRKNAALRAVVLHAAGTALLRSLEPGRGGI